MLSIKFDNIMSYILIHILRQFSYFHIITTQINLHIFGFKLLFLSIDHWSWIIYNVFVIILFSAYHAHFLFCVCLGGFINTIYSTSHMTWSINASIYYPSVFKWQYRYYPHFICTYVFLIHPYVVSYIIPYFMNELFSYIQWMNFFICSNLVAEL